MIQVSRACQSLEELPKGELLRERSVIRQFVDVYGMSMPLLKSVGVKYLSLKWKKFDSLLSEVGGSENIFRELLGDYNVDNTFWLDSSSTDKVSSATTPLWSGHTRASAKALELEAGDLFAELAHNFSLLTAHFSFLESVALLDEATIRGFEHDVVVVASPASSSSSGANADVERCWRMQSDTTSM
ncbi:hypothetical protein BHE74_00035485 [Ensete ventricosum]|nr:hypothetical protein BHE74_00035485 [Ensete ventricosum]